VPCLCRYWNDPEVLSKLGKAMGGSFDLPGMLGAAPLEAPAEEEEAEEEEGEDTLHSTASAGVHVFITCLPCIAR
jgi:hypothetical protein